MGPLAMLFVPRRARGHWDEEAFARLRRRATWLAFPPAIFVGFLAILLHALFGAKTMGDVASAVIWAGVTGAAFFFLRRRIERCTIMALRKTVHLRPTGTVPSSDESEPVT